MKAPSYFVFDVESVGLHGQGFAVGWVVVEARTGVELDSYIVASQFDAATAGARESDIAWVTEHVLPGLDAGTSSCRMVRTPAEVRDRFWSEWVKWREHGAVLAADVAWPVEARFLAACIDDAPITRNWEGPYPLVDIASVRLAKGLDPLGTEERQRNELPAHNPLADARQSARLLLEALRS